MIIICCYPNYYQSHGSGSTLNNYLNFFEPIPLKIKCWSVEKCDKYTLKMTKKW
jgi:hypothetical protein